MMKKLSILSLAISILASFIVISAVPQKTEALSGSEFQAGRIIDDGIFFNGTGMSVNEIQTFLNAKVPQCDTWGNQPYGGTTAANYGSARGYPPPYICMKDYGQATWQIPGDSYCNGFSAGSKTAAQIIHEVAASCGINPMVILITLQKEQSLVTDNWPWSRQFDKATGYDCPDNPPATWPSGCNPNYVGFFRQVYYGARQFKRYAFDTNIFTNYRPQRTSYIQYNPNAGCGGSNIYIQNQATSGLYVYTPYQPNQAALNNLYGTGDGCSAYGNRNFWRLFNDWFGSPLGSGFSARYHKQSPSLTLRAGQTQKVFFDFKNTGTMFWKDNTSTFPGYHPVNLATTRNINRISGFSSLDWHTGSRPGGKFTKVFEADGVTPTTDWRTVHPGQIARFEFTLTAPINLPAGTYREYFQPILEGSSSWNMGAEAWIDVTVPKSTTSASYKAQSAYPTLSQNESKRVFFEYKNTGDTIWYNQNKAPYRIPPTRLASTGPINRTSPFNKNWPEPSRPATTITKVFQADGITPTTDWQVVHPGQIARFEFTLTAPANLPAGTYREYFQPILEGSSSWNMGGVTYLDVTVLKPFSASYSRQSPYPTIPRGSSRTVYFDYKNTGSNFWKDDTSTFPGYPPTRLASTGPINRTSPFNKNWPYSTRPVAKFTKVFEADGITPSNDWGTVHPGQIARFEFTLTAPANLPAGTYREYFQPILEGSSSWNMGGVTYLDVTVAH